MADPASLVQRVKVFLLDSTFVEVEVRPDTTVGSAKDEVGRQLCDELRSFGTNLSLFSIFILLLREECYVQRLSANRNLYELLNNWKNDDTWKLLFALSFSLPSTPPPPQTLSACLDTIDLQFDLFPVSYFNPITRPVSDERKAARRRFEEKKLAFMQKTDREFKATSSTLNKNSSRQKLQVENDGSSSQENESTTDLPSNSLTSLMTSISSFQSLSSPASTAGSASSLNVARYNSSPTTLTSISPSTQSDNSSQFYNGSPSIEVQPSENLGKIMGGLSQRLSFITGKERKRTQGSKILDVNNKSKEGGPESPTELGSDEAKRSLSNRMASQTVSNRISVGTTSNRTSGNSSFQDVGFSQGARTDKDSQSLSDMEPESVDSLSESLTALPPLHANSPPTTPRGLIPNNLNGRSTPSGTGDARISRSFTAPKDSCFQKKKSTSTHQILVKETRGPNLRTLLKSETPEVSIVPRSMVTRSINIHVLDGTAIKANVNEETTVGNIIDNLLLHDVGRMSTEYAIFEIGEFSERKIATIERILTVVREWSGGQSKMKLIFKPLKASLMLYFKDSSYEEIQLTSSSVTRDVIKHVMVLKELKGSTQDYKICLSYADKELDIEDQEKLLELQELVDFDEEKFANAKFIFKENQTSGVIQVKVEDGTRKTLPISSTTSVSDVIRILAKKLFLPSHHLNSLYIADDGKEKILDQEEKPLLLQASWREKTKNMNEYLLFLFHSPSFGSDDASGRSLTLTSPPLSPKTPPSPPSQTSRSLTVSASPVASPTSPSSAVSPPNRDKEKKNLLGWFKKDAATRPKTK